MTATVQQATDDMFGAVKAPLVSAFPDVVRKYDGIDDHEPPDANVSWVYASVRHAAGSQGSLAGADGSRRWNRQGTLIVQCFVPLHLTGRDGAMAIAAALQNSIQRLHTPHGVWFTNATLREVGVSDAWYQVNFSATFSYDDIN